MNNGDRVLVQFPSYSKMAYFVSQDGDDMVVAVDEHGKRVHHRVYYRDVFRFQSCDPSDAKKFHEENFEELKNEIVEAAGELLPGIVLKTIPNEHTIVCESWGVRIVPDVMQTKGIGRVVEKPSWCVDYETLASNYRDEGPLHDVVTVGNYPSTSLAAEAFISCISERRIQSHFESRSFF